MKAIERMHGDHNRLDRQLTTADGSWFYAHTLLAIFIAPSRLTVLKWSKDDSDPTRERE